MAHNKPLGSFVALITPMNSDGTVDYEGFRTLMRWHEENGTQAVLIMGLTGEVSMLSTEERREITTRTSKMKSDRLAVYFGTSGNNTAATIEYTQFAKGEGADGVIFAAPAYICADEDSIRDFALEVLDSTDLAMGFYNNPPRVNTDLHWEHILRLAEHPNMVVLKESTTKVGQIAQICAAQPDMSIMCCCSPNLGLVIPTMALGGHGTANMTGNIIPQEMATISKPWTDGDEPYLCRRAWLDNLNVLHFAYSAINPVAVKSLMRAVGLPSGPLRKPLRPLDQKHLQYGLRELDRLGIARKYDFRLGPIADAAE